MPDGEPLFWSLADLRRAFEERALSPVEVAQQALDRIAALDGRLHSYLSVTADLALAQAREAEACYAQEGAARPPLLGVPLSIKDLFDVRGEVTTLGSRVHAGQVAPDDSGAVSRLRAGGAVFLGKSNTAEFGQWATTENRLAPPCGNPWNPARTAGGSSGGAAASVAAGLATGALGSDGGGSIRIPAAMCGLFGIKPTLGAAPAEGSFRAMTDFACPGPIVRRVADARPLLAALLGRGFPARHDAPRLRIAWCAAPEGRPVDPGVAAAAAAAVQRLQDLGHEVEEFELPLEGWPEAFGPLVLADEWRYRRHLLDGHRDELTTYARRSIEAAERVTEDDVRRARALRQEITERIARLFARFDAIVTPTTAVPAFPHGERPTEIAGRPVEPLWGPYPFTAPFNVSGSPAASLPVGLVGDLPVGLQIVGAHHAENVILDLCEELETAVGFPAEALARRWTVPAAAHAPAGGGDVVLERRGAVAVVRLARPHKRNAMTLEMLRGMRAALAQAAAGGARAVVLTGSGDTFSAGMDLGEIGNGASDIAVDDAIADAVAAIRGAPVPVLAAVDGPCVGAAVELALACDARVAGAGAFFQLPSARLGILYRPEAVADLVAQLGRQTAARLLVLGERIDAEGAVAAGMAACVVAEGEAVERAVAVAAGAAEGSAAAVTATRELIAEVASAPSDLGHWGERRRALLVSDERRRALAAARGVAEPVEPR
jgi:Asp-tRNA(Asn)/Glu-tRNA(Gln) amidotransferase A subunit family amidase/enoyl-CoA hydratase/carnithine racemase